VYDPNNPVAQPLGQMHTMNALAPQGVRQMPVAMPGGGLTGAPLQPQMQPPIQKPDNSWHQDWRNALMGWRDDRPMFDPATMQRGDWQQQMMDWRGQRPDRQDFRLGQAPGMAGVAGVPNMPGAGVPGAPNIQFPPNMQLPPNMVGTQLGVIGAAPAASPYGLPTY
jgi:hypothetical protein